MKRDMDLVREILLTIESMETRYEHLNVPDYPVDSVNHHLDLLISAGIVNGEMNWTFGGPATPIVESLSWEGYDFLDAIRNESIWSKTKDFMKERDLQGIPIELLKAVATDFAKQQLGLGSS